uniref:CHK kinase-like domain-containing protein n=1 Tax=Panagrolaimus sp. JU765 TaxID=591449 RepID=A0AC34Q8A6_9BILA
MHNTECEFYNSFAEKFDFLPLAKVYGTKLWTKTEDGLILMEDLSKTGRLQFLPTSVNMAQIKEMTILFAKMHKIILTMDEKEWKGKFIKNQSTFADMVQMITTQIDKFLNNSNKFREYLEPYINKYRKLLGSSELVTYVHGKAHLDVGLDSVLCHGDLWLANIFWKTDSNGEVSSKISALIDWQIMHEGNPMADLCRFLISCADGHIRRQAETFIIQFYLDVLESEFKKDGKICPFSLEQLQKAYDLFFIPMSFMLIPATTITITTLKKEEADGYHRKALFDIGYLRALHAMEDVDRLIESNYKFIFDKYGL